MAITDELAAIFNAIQGYNQGSPLSRLTPSPLTPPARALGGGGATSAFNPAGAKVDLSAANADTAGDAVAPPTPPTPGANLDMRKLAVIANRMKSSKPATKGFPRNGGVNTGANYDIPAMAATANDVSGSTAGADLTPGAGYNMPQLAALANRMPTDDPGANYDMPGLSAMAAAAGGGATDPAAAKLSAISGRVDGGTPSAIPAELMPGLPSTLTPDDMKVVAGKAPASPAVRRKVPADAAAAAAAPAPDSGATPAPAASTPPSGSGGLGPIGAIPRLPGMSDKAYNDLGLAAYYESDFRPYVPNYLYGAKGRTAGGLFQITDSNWNHYSKGMNIQSRTNPGQLAKNAMDASPEDQTRVAHAMYKEQGLKPWVPYNDRLRNAIARGEKLRPPTDGGGGTAPPAGGAPATAAAPAAAVAPADPSATGSRVNSGVNATTATSAAPAATDPAAPVAADPSAPPAAGAAPASGAAPAAGAPDTTSNTNLLQHVMQMHNVQDPSAAPIDGAGAGGSQDPYEQHLEDLISQSFGSHSSGFPTLDKISNFLNNPLMQGALSAYFGGISAPKHTSPMGRLGIGGLTGLKGFSEAEAQQAKLTDEELKAYESLADLPLKRAQTQASYAEAGLHQQQAQEITAGRRMATDVWAPISQNPDATPEQRELASGLYAAALSDMPVKDQMEYFRNSRNDLVTNWMHKQQGTLAGAEAGVQPTIAARNTSAAALNQANTGLVPTRKAALEAETKERNAQAEAAGYKGWTHLIVTNKDDSSDSHGIWIKPGENFNPPYPYTIATPAQIQESIDRKAGQQIQQSKPSSGVLPVQVAPNVTVLSPTTPGFAERYLPGGPRRTVLVGPPGHRQQYNMPLNEANKMADALNNGQGYDNPGLNIHIPPPKAAAAGPPHPPGTPEPPDNAGGWTYVHSPTKGSGWVKGGVMHLDSERTGSEAAG
jgi:hypothetical protein